MSNRGLYLFCACAGAAFAAPALAQPFDVVAGTGTFTDISSAPGVITVATGDDLSAPFTSSVTNALFPSANLFASTNGNITNVVHGAFTNTALPVATVTDGAYPFWDDLFADTAQNGAVLAATVTEGGQPVQIVQWNNVRTFAGGAGTGTGTFQVKIYGTGPILAQYIYQDVDFSPGGEASSNGASATVGVQWETNAATQFSMNSPVIQAGTVLNVVQGIGGACCLPNGTCSVQTQAGCTAAGGAYGGNGSTCAVACPTGRCCLPNMTCTVTSQSACASQNGVYGGNGSDCSTACPTPPGTCNVTGALPSGPSSWAATTYGSQTGRLFRDGVPDTCAAPGTPGTPIAGTFAYAKHTFVNTGAAACIQVDFNTPCAGTNFIYAGAYIGGYNPASPTTNNVASIGGSPNPTASMSFNVPAGGTFDIVVAEVTPGAGCSGYTMFLSGGTLNCASGGTCYANCDNSTTTPVLNVADFTCFLQRYAAGESYANCDQSTTPPVLNVADFTCFLQRYAAGCP